MKLRSFMMAFLIGTLVLAVSGVQANDTSTAKAKYAKGRFIVKFKSEGSQALNEDVEYLLESKQKFQSAVADGSDSLDKLHRKHKVRRARSLFVERHGLTTQDARDKQRRAQRLSEIRHQYRGQRAPRNVESPDLSNTYVIEVPPEENIEAIVSEYQQDPHVEFAQPDYLVEAQMIPNDPYYSRYGSWGQAYDDLWGLKKIQNAQAWDLTQGEGIVVAVVDTGLDYNHPDIAANVWTNPGEIPNNGIDDDGNGFVDDVRGWDFTICVSRDVKGNCLQSKSPDNDPMDGAGHGTHVSGTIAAVGNNSLGIIGVAPKAKIMPVKGLEDTGSGYTSHLAAGIIYAAENGADVINNSWGCSSSCPSNPIAENAVRTAYSLGAVVVFAAGNDSSDASQYSPQNMKDSKPIVVSATTHQDVSASFSNFGALVDVAAPGNDILSLRAVNTGTGSTSLVGTEYRRMSGTSMAAPHTSGAAALVVAYRPTLTNEEVRQILRAAANDVGSPGFDMKTGVGRLNAARALTTIPPKLSVKISSPANGARYASQQTIIITGTASGADFQKYELFYGIGVNPSSWVSLGPVLAPVQNATLGTLTLDLNALGLPDPAVLLRLVVTAVSGVQFDDVVAINISNVKQVTTNSLDQAYPAISGNLIVWHDVRNDGLGDIYLLYDLSTNTERRITTSTAQQLYPVISGNLIVWEDYRNGSTNADIYLYDLSLNTERRITTNSSNQLNPAISGNLIVWDDNRNGNYDIYLYDLSTNTERRITTNTSNQLYPAISGNLIVWHDGRNGNTDIYLYDLSTNTERRITTNASNQAYPAISGNLIVWQDSRNLVYDIYLYDLSTNTERRITTNSSLHQNPAISGNLIVWQDDRNSNRTGYDYLKNYDIYLYDLSTNREQQITGNTSSQLYPAISGNQVVWHDLRNGNHDIYSYKYILLNQPPVLSTIGNKTVNAGSNLAFTITATDPNGGTLTYSASGLPAGATFNASTRAFSWTPTTSQAGNYNVTFTVSDGSLTDTETITITVAAPATGAAITAPAPGSTLTATTVLFTWSAGSATSFFLAVGTTQASVAASPWGDIFHTAWGTQTSANVTGIPLNGKTVYVRLYYKIGTTQYFKDYTYQTQMSSVNQPPVLAAIGNKTVQIGQLLNFTVSASDPDGGVLTYYSNPTIYGSTFSNGVYSWTPVSGQAGSYAVTFTVTDPGGLSDSETITITAAAVNNPPVLAAIGNKSVTVGTNLSFVISATDVDGDTLTYSATGLPTGATFNASTRAFSWTPTTSQAGNYNVTFTVSDGSLTDTETITITVAAPATGAAITAPAPGSTLTATTVLFTWSAGSATSFFLAVGTTQASVAASPWGDIFHTAWGTQTSANVTNIPLNGSTVYVRLYYKIGTTQYFKDYTYTTANIPVVHPAVTSPAPGSTLSATTVPFTWSAGSATSFFLAVGTTQASVAASPWGNIFHTAWGTQTSANVTNIPLNGSTVYVRLYYKIGTTQYFKDYTYQTRSP